MKEKALIKWIVIGGALFASFVLTCNAQTPALDQLTIHGAVLSGVPYDTARAELSRGDLCGVKVNTPAPELEVIRYGGVIWNWCCDPDFVNCWFCGGRPKKD